MKVSAMNKTPFAKKWLSEKAKPRVIFDPKPHQTRKRIELMEEKLRCQASKSPN
ncbi:hypothetical protein VSVS12_04428 (plasmid) [Vibrio scophthalmi]|uniref:Uncharacterized protein n=1 Tax=Vibrio scophthalmi TaxID=45658 RepID=A0A1B1NWP1_9VIBR|nr:hypothetical protein VSVS12_04428 [Vibrio scophthalmi]ANU39389.1 hypothetical protein VSVS05_04354 [Vibrio scophthalmi]